MAMSSTLFTFVCFLTAILTPRGALLTMPNPSYEERRGLSRIADLKHSESARQAGRYTAREALVMLVLAFHPAAGWQAVGTGHAHGSSLDNLSVRCARLNLADAQLEDAVVQLKDASGPELDDASEAPSLYDLRVFELKAICRAKGLKTIGKKATLIERIEDAPEGIPEKKRTVKRPQNAWMLFLSKYREEQDTKGVAVTKVAADAGAKWKQMSEDDKAPFLAEAKALMNEFTFGTATPTLDTSMAAFDVSSFRADASDGLEVEVEVSTAEQVREEELNEERSARRARRRERLSSYFSEEYTKVQGELQQAAGPAYITEFGSPKVEAFSLMGTEIKYAIPPSRPMLSGGYKLAWCLSFDAEAGTGVLVNLDDKHQMNVTRDALKTREDLPMPERRLYPGEFVQYNPHMAKLGVSGAKWVAGVSGWPLMCQSYASLGLVDPAMLVNTEPDTGNRKADGSPAKDDPSLNKAAKWFWNMVGLDQH